MAEKKKKNRFYTVLFIPEDSGRTTSLRVHREILRSLVIFIVLFVVGIATLVYLSGDIAARLQLVYSLQKQNANLRSENDKLLAIAAKVDTIQVMSDYLRRLAMISADDRPTATTRAAVAHQEMATDIFSKDGLDNQLDTMRLVHNAGLQPGKNNLLEQAIDAMPYIRPVEGWVTRRFAGGENGHPGIDFAAPPGALIRATAPGVVTAVATDPELGRVVTIQHGAEITTQYGHCSQIVVQTGDRVTRGQTIALVGNTGRSSAPHLHYEVIRDGKFVDPLRYMLDNEE